MVIHHILSKTVLVAVLMLYLCLRTQVQCHVDSSVPHSHFPAISQKVINAVCLNVTNPDLQQILSTLSPYAETTYSVPATLYVIYFRHVSSRANHCSGCFGERSPPACQPLPSSILS